MTNHLSPKLEKLYQFFVDNPDVQCSCKSEELINHYNTFDKSSSVPSVTLSSLLSQLHKEGLVARKNVGIKIKTYYGHRTCKVFHYRLKRM